MINLAQRRIGISVKLMLATFALLAGVLVTLSWSTYRNSAQMLEEGRRASMSNLVQHTGGTISALQEKMGSLLLSVAANLDLWEMSDERVVSTLETYRRYQPLVGSIYLVRDEGRIVGAPRPFVPALGNLLAPVIREHLSDNSGLIWTTPYLSRLSHWTTTVATRVFLPDGTSPGYVAMDIPILSLIYDGLPTLSFDDGSTLLIVTHENEIVVADFRNPLLGYRLSTNQLDAPAGVAQKILEAKAGNFSQISIGGEDFSLLVGPATPNGWRPILLFSNAALQRSRQLAAQTTLALLGLVGLVSLALSGLVARYFAKPLEQLTQEMARVQMGRLEGIDPPKRNDEISDLVRAFNRMMERIRQLLDDLRQSEQAKKVTEIRWLQAQIKPHFLYNSLNAIGHSAAMGRTQDVYDMIQSLTHVLSYTFRQDSQGAENSSLHRDERVLLAEEMEFLEHYVRLQQIRYGRSFQTIYAIDPGLGRCRLLRLSLQPIVENAILHGLSQMQEGGTLHIVARHNRDNLEIRVSDNGRGISPERLAAIGDMEDIGGRHLGIRNVSERLALYYGDRASLMLESPNPYDPTGRGTCVTILLPFGDGVMAESSDTIAEAETSGVPQPVFGR